MSRRAGNNYSGARWAFSRTQPGHTCAGAPCSGCWQKTHEGHDVAQRHQNGLLASATCHDCNATYTRPVPAVPEETE